MGKNIDRIRKKIESRRRDIQGKAMRRERSAPQLFNRHDEARDEPDFYLYQEEKQQNKWMEKDWFILRSMIAVAAFFIIAILFQNNSSQLDGARQFVKDSYQQEFNFAAISNWYENQFGRPLALIPRTNEVAMGDVESNPEIAYALPASGQIRESFQQNGKGILVETEADAFVEAVRSGVVISIGNQENIGKTIGVKHYDGSESWYGMLEAVEVKLYDHIEAGSLLGKVSGSSEAGKGVFYFSIKYGEEYIDPNEVISFD